MEFFWERKRVRIFENLPVNQDKRKKEKTEPKKKQTKKKKEKEKKEKEANNKKKEKNASESWVEVAQRTREPRRARFRGVVARGDARRVGRAGDGADEEERRESARAKERACASREGPGSRRLKFFLKENYAPQTKNSGGLKRGSGEPDGPGVPWVAGR